MQVRWIQTTMSSRRLSAVAWFDGPLASALLRNLLVLLLGTALLAASTPAMAANRGKAAASRKAKAAKPAKRAGKTSRAAKPAAASQPAASHQPIATPSSQAPAVALPAAATPTTAARSDRAPASAVPAVALPRAATPVAAAAKTDASKPAVNPASAKPAPAKPAAAKPAAAKPALAKAAAVGLPGAATPTARPVAAPAKAVALAADPSAVHALPSAVSPTTAALPPRRAATAPVATAWALPQVPADKLASDIKQQSIVRLIQQGKFSEALAEVDALLEKSPNDDELQVQRARLLYWLERRDAARATLTPVQARHPADAEIRELDAQMLLADGDVPGALAQYRALEIAGDGRPEIHQRIIDLALQLEEHEAVAQSLRWGGKLTEEQSMAYTRLAHPWFVDLAGSTTLHSGSAWWRLDGHLGRRLNKRFSVLLGGIYEQRAGADGETERAGAAKGELFFGFGPLDGMLHLEGSPNKTILAQYDGRLDLALSLVKAFSLGLYGRYAHFATSATSQTLPTTAWTLAPNVIFYVKDWTIQPGYMLIHLDPSVTTQTNYFHTGFVKARWEPTPRWMAFAWLYLGTDPTFVERYGIQTPTGTSLVLGGERWWTPRWGTRLSASRVQPFDSKNDAYTEFTLVLRGRL